MPLENPNDITRLRLELGLSQLELARAVGVTQASISYLERIKGSKELFDKVAEYLLALEKKRGDGPRDSELLKQLTPVSVTPNIDDTRLLDLGNGWTAAFITFSPDGFSSDLVTSLQHSNERFSIAIADLIGSGKRNALRAEQIRFLLHGIGSTVTSATHHPGFFISQIAQAILSLKTWVRESPAVAVLCINSQTNSFLISNYGMPPALKIRRNAEIQKYTPVSASYMSRAGSLPFATTEVTLDEGDSFLIFSDGFEDWLRDSTDKVIRQSPDNFLKGVCAEFAGYARSILNSAVTARTENGTRPPNDDVSLLILSRRAKEH